MKKNIIIIFIISLVIFLSVVASLLFSTKNIVVKSNPIDSSKIEGQIEYISQDQSGINFLTYRETALARYTEDGNLSILSEQVFTGVIDNVWYWPNNDKLLIKFVNDPEVLIKVSGYKENMKNESIYATYQISNKKLLILPEGPENCWLSVDRIVGIKNNELYTLSGPGWKKTDIKTNSSKPIVSSNGTLIGDLNNETLDIYSIATGQKMRSIKEIKANLGQIRLFDNGDVLVVDGSEVVKLYKISGKTKSIKVPAEEQIIVGKNVFIYSNKNDVYGYFSGESKTYRIKGLPKKMDFLNIYGLSSVGAVYYAGENYNFDLIKFEK